MSSTDVPASVRFYGEIFGWQADMNPDPAARGYGQFRLNGRKVAGIGPIQAPGMPTVWNTYVATEDAAMAADRVKNSGGTIIMEPTPIFDAGTMAAFQAPDGSYASVWQPGEHLGAELVNEPGAFCWNELVTRDPAEARRFYSAVFSWTPADLELDGATYTELRVGEKSIAGMMPMPADLPPETPSYWMTYFAVADLDTTVGAAERAGATVMVGRMDAPEGPFAMLTDPQGGAFSVIQLNESR
ncbi:VOC family protein [Nonomuraea sp. NN258]|uniref:VOC family protein n=1 Tax=Nonomuraea antri TaxID=2730852 RepID=UPI0015688F8C|nr:VOC family protein [Nonomuraea antri]NRQ30384.1 VOC family protein [Nonomuraea antri]